MKRSRAYFFTGVDGITGHLFRTENRPRRTTFEDLFDSVPFILEPNDSAQENQSGHIRLETDTRAKGRMAPLTDGWSRAVQGHQLPVVRNQMLAGDVVVSTGTYGGIQITEMDYVDPSTGRVRRDFMIQNGMALTSSDGSFVITNIPNGFDITAAVGLADTFKVMADAGDPTPGYLDTKVGDALYITAGHKINVKHSGFINGAIVTTNAIDGLSANLQITDTNTIALIVGGTLSANIRYNATWFTEDVTGLRLLPHGITQNEIALGTILGTNINANPGFFFGDGLNHDGTRMYARVHKSLQLDPAGGANIKPIELVGDAAAPGGSKYYGTDPGGAKGFHDLVPYLDSRWEGTLATSGINSKGSSSSGKAPFAVAMGIESSPWIHGSIGNAINAFSQSMDIHLGAQTVGAVSSTLRTTDNKNVWFPDKCSSIIEGTVIGIDVATGDNVIYKFSFSTKTFGGATFVFDTFYTNPVPATPIFVDQAAVAPYATAFANDMGAPDMAILEIALSNEFGIWCFGEAAKTISWSAHLKVHVLGYDTFTVPAYTP